MEERIEGVGKMDTERNSQEGKTGNLKAGGLGMGVREWEVGLTRVEKGSWFCIGDDLRWR